MTARNGTKKSSVVETRLVARMLSAPSRKSETATTTNRSGLI